MQCLDQKLQSYLKIVVVFEKVMRKQPRIQLFTTIHISRHVRVFGLIVRVHTTTHRIHHHAKPTSSPS
jgi:hypothetical protein